MSANSSYIDLNSSDIGGIADIGGLDDPLNQDDIGGLRE